VCSRTTPRPPVTRAFPDVRIGFGTFAAIHSASLMRHRSAGFHGRDLLSNTIKVQCKSNVCHSGRGSSSIADGAAPYDVVHLAGGTA